MPTPDDDLNAERAMDHMVGMKHDLQLLGPELAQACLDLRPRCEWSRHSLGTYGCDPSMEAEYVVIIKPHCQPAAQPHLLLVCSSQYERITAQLGNPWHCTLCNARATWGAVIEQLGTIRDYQP